MIEVLIVQLEIVDLLVDYLFRGLVLIEGGQEDLFLLFVKVHSILGNREIQHP